MASLSMLLDGVLSRRATCALLASAALAAGPGYADTVSSTDVILTLVNSKIEGVHGRIEFTRADLLAMEQRTIETGNDFVDGTAKFRGPLAASVVEMIGHAGAKKVTLTSVTDFSVTVDIAELKKYQAILALEMNGKALTLRTRGPIWLIYPMDLYPELSDPAFNSRLVWQLEVIELL